MKLDPVEFVHPVEVSPYFCPLLLAALFVLSTLRLPLLPQQPAPVRPAGAKRKTHSSTLILVSVLFRSAGREEILFL